MQHRPAELVESFYNDVWNNRDFAAAHRIIAADLRFRGSLGSEKVGIAGFLDYVDAIHAALGDYTCIIRDLIENADRVAARMTFKGRHRGEFFGVAPTGMEIEWAGAAFFTIRDGQIADIWVLGDVDTLKQQLHAHSAAKF